MLVAHYYKCADEHLQWSGSGHTCNCNLMLKTYERLLTTKLFRFLSIIFFVVKTLPIYELLVSETRVQPD